MTEDALELRADPRHATEIIRAMDLDSGKSDSTSIGRVLESTATHDRELLDRIRASILRSVCMRAAYMSIDRYYLHYTAKDAAREIHPPTERLWAIMKRMAGYLLGCPRLTTTFVRQHQPDRIRFFTDSDHAGCRKTRKSTSSMIILHDMHCIELYHLHNSQSYCHHQRVNTTRSSKDIVYQHEIPLATPTGTWESFGDSHDVGEGQPTRRVYETSCRKGCGRS